MADTEGSLILSVSKRGLFLTHAEGFHHGRRNLLNTHASAPAAAANTTTDRGAHHTSS